MDYAIIVIANYALYVSVLLTIYVWLKLGSKDRKQFIILALVAATATLLLATLASWAYYNPRPFVVGPYTPLFPHPNNNGFPSDHTLFTSYLAFLVIIYRRRLGICMLVLAAVIGASRVAAGVHHVIDIVAAILISGIAIGLSWYLLRFWASRKPPRIQKVTDSK